MNPATEVAPFFSATADPHIPHTAVRILRHLRATTSRPGATSEFRPEHRSALPGISALLACERHGVSLVSHDAARRTSASTPTVFDRTLNKCRTILDAAPLDGTPSPAARATGRKSMAPARSPAPPVFDPLNLPGSSAKRVAAPLVGRRGTRDLSDFRRKPAAGKETAVPPTPSAAPSPPPRQPEPVIPPPTPQTPSKPRPAPTKRTPAPAPTSPTRRHLAPRTPTGHGSPMHNALMKGKLEQASAVRLSGARGKQRAREEEDEEDGVTSPSKRQHMSAGDTRTADLLRIQESPTDASPNMGTMLASRPTISANKINTLFHPLPTFPLDPYTSIPPPPLVFTGPTIFYQPAEGRVAGKMVPPDDVAWGDPYALMHRRRGEDASLPVLTIDPAQVGEAVAKRERGRKRRLKRLLRVQAGFTMDEVPVLDEWDREFGVPLDVGVEAGVADWQERLEIYHATIPDGIPATIQSLQRPTVVPEQHDPPAVDGGWITRAESHGIAIRVSTDS